MAICYALGDENDTQRQRCISQRRLGQYEPGRLGRGWQYKYLDNFANDIYSGKVPLTNLKGEINGNLMRRADLYGQAGITTHHEMAQRQAAAGGADVVRRVLDGAAKHCDCCIDQAALGWVMMTDPNLLPIGSCTCATNCRCSKEFSTAEQITAAGGNVMEPPKPEKPKTEAQIIHERGQKYDPMRQHLPGHDKFTPEYLQAIDEKKLTQQTFESFPGELQGIEDKVGFEFDTSQIAQRYGRNPAQMGADEWAGLADRIKDDAIQELKFATDPQRVAEANKKAGRIFIGNRPDKQFIQVGGKSIEQQWIGGSRKMAAEELKTINAATRNKATDYMQKNLIEMGYTRAQVDNIAFTSAKRLLAEIGNEALLENNKVFGMSREVRAKVVENATGRARLNARSIAYNPRAGEGLDLWLDYETAMLKAGRERAIEFPPELVESTVPDFVKYPGGKKPPSRFTPSQVDTSPIDF